MRMRKKMRSSHFSNVVPFDLARKIENRVLNRPKISHFRPSFSSSSRRSYHRDFSAFAKDVLMRISVLSEGLTTVFQKVRPPDLQTTSLVCKSWRGGLRPLLEAMLFLGWRKRLKHVVAGWVKHDIHKALDSFLKGVTRGSTLAMVDVRLIYWEKGKKEGVNLCRRVVEHGDPTCQCNLGEKIF
ncbi:hypothetical protein L6452_14935 [Arctium lappa]|uniref:Uncharacterized protein n=1 Tax=Arctium lappa TaxID=4217 RepID=A0ACB9CMN4_ARCLA|nr:hypothetical protein L6452_14935 [Arctium lappa]